MLILIEMMPNGLNKILVGQGKNKAYASIYMSEKEFFQMIDRMMSVLKYYEHMIFPQAFKRAMDLEQKQREERA